MDTRTKELMKELRAAIVEEVKEDILFQLHEAYELAHRRFMEAKSGTSLEAFLDGKQVGIERAINIVSKY